MINCTVEFMCQGQPARGRVVGREGADLLILIGHKVYRELVGNVVLTNLVNHQILYTDYDLVQKVGRVVEHDTVTCAIFVENSLDKKRTLIDKPRVNFLLKGGQRA